MTWNYYWKIIIGLLFRLCYGSYLITCGCTQFLRQVEAPVERSMGSSFHLKPLPSAKPILQLTSELYCADLDYSTKCLCLWRWFIWNYDEHFLMRLFEETTWRIFLVSFGLYNKCYLYFLDKWSYTVRKYMS